jgi:CheY-like chemotaxis protein
MARRRKKILLVEDNDDVRQLLGLFVKRLRYEVYEAATGLEAVDQAAATRPDLIIMDFCLPVFSGIEATRRLKMNPSTQDIPVLIITGYNIDKRRAVVVGAVDILQKPIDMTRFRGLLHRYVSGQNPRHSRRKK